MQDLRIVLVIVGALAIAALVLHGLWTNQRNKRAQQKNTAPKAVAAKRSSESRDVDGFDADGIGKVRLYPVMVLRCGIMILLYLLYRNSLPVMKMTYCRDRMRY